MKSKLYHVENSKTRGQTVYNEPPHQDLRCLQIQIFLSLVVKELKIPLDLYCRAPDKGVGRGGEVLKIIQRQLSLFLYENICCYPSLERS